MTDTEIETYVEELVAKAQAESDAAAVVMAAVYASAEEARQAALDRGENDVAAQACYDAVIRNHIRTKLAQDEREFRQAQNERLAADKILYSGGSNPKAHP